MATRSKVNNTSFLQRYMHLWFFIATISAACLLAPAKYLPGALAQTTQANCDAYSTCTALQGTSQAKLQGPITYSFDNAALSAMLGNDPVKIKDFKDRFEAQAKDWAEKTGVSITPAAAGSSGNLTVTMSNSDTIRDENGEANTVNGHGTLTISNEYSSWSEAGKDRLFAHELGHFLGLRDVKPNECTGLNTVMRQLGEESNVNGIVADAQLMNGYTCVPLGGDPTKCADRLKLPQPPQATPCDAAKAKAIQQAQVPAGDDGSGGGGDTSCYDSTCEPYYDAGYYWWWDSYSLPEGYVTVNVYDVSVDVYYCDDAGCSDPADWDFGDGGCYNYSSYGSCF